MTTRKDSHVSGLHVMGASSREKRLCLRPERQPGKAPPCEDDAVQNLGDRTKYAPPVSLHKLKWMEKSR
jgi:hypothetical protein